MGPVIDAFSHILPKTFGEELSRRYPTDELRALAAVKHFHDVENRVRLLDKYKIDQQVLTLARPSIWINMPEEIVLTMTRAANNAVSEVAKQFPERFIPVGTLPNLRDEFLPEFDRCMGELGMAGIQIFSNMGGRPLDDPEFRPFFERAHRTRTPLWLHSQIRVEWSTRFAQDKLFGWPFDTSLALSQLVFSGMMEDYPNLTIITHHMGGMIPFFSERIKVFYDAAELFPQAKFVSLAKDPLVYFMLPEATSLDPRFCRNDGELAYVVIPGAAGARKMDYRFIEKLPYQIFKSYALKHFDQGQGGTCNC